MSPKQSKVAKMKVRWPKKKKMLLKQNKWPNKKIPPAK
jgi:hypothetical protein